MGTFEQIFSLIFSANFAFSVIRVTTPILFAALGGLISAKAGVLNMTLEGTMLTSALTGVVVSATVRTLVLNSGGAVGNANTIGTAAGFFAGVLAGVMVALLLGYMAVQLRANIVLTGIAINMMAAGGTIFIMYLVCGDKGISSSITSGTMPVINIPFLKDIPVLGRILSGHNSMVYICMLCVPIVYFLMMKTAIGLRIRAVGENPNAAESVGINVKKIKFTAMMLSGLFCGLGGVSLSMSYVSFFSKNMTAGKGFIGMSAMNLGGAAPIGTTLAALLFGFFDAMANILQSLAIPNQFIVSIPYVATLIGLVVSAIRTESRIKAVKRANDKKIADEATA